jgi:predicted ATPase
MRIILLEQPEHDDTLWFLNLAKQSIREWQLPAIRQLSSQQEVFTGETGQGSHAASQQPPYLMLAATDYTDSRTIVVATANTNTTVGKER